MTTTDARMRVWDLASRISRARRLASVHMIFACRSALESSRSRCWAGYITSTDRNSLHETGNGMGRRLFCGSQVQFGSTKARTAWTGDVKRSTSNRAPFAGWPRDVFLEGDDHRGSPLDYVTSRIEQPGG